MKRLTLDRTQFNAWFATSQTQQPSPTETALETEARHVMPHHLAAHCAQQV